MLVVDTQDAASAFGSEQGANAAHLKRLIGRLDMPGLEPLPDDHVLTRSFYLLRGEPGRWGEGTTWVAAGGGGQLVESRALGEPTALVNDGVSPIVLGSGGLGRRVGGRRLWPAAIPAWPGRRRGAGAGRIGSGSTS